MKVKKIIQIGILCTMLLSITACSSKEDKEPISESINETGVQEEVLVPVSIFFEDSVQGGLISEDKQVPEVTPEILVSLLAEKGVISRDVSVLAFTVGENNGNRVIYLDLSKEIVAYLNSVGEARGNLVINAMTNTFLQAYECTGILYTTEGLSLETDYKLYNTFQTGYDGTSKEASYSITETSEKTEIIDVIYPQITGMADAELEASFNQHLLRAAMDYEADCLVDYQLRYEVTTINEDILSIVYRAYLNYDGAAHPYAYILTFNFDLKNGKELRLSDIAPIDTMTDKILKGEYQIIGPDYAQTEIKDFIATSYTDAAILGLDQFDFNPEDETYIAYGYSYIKNNHPVICISTCHAMGDYAELEIEYDLK